MDMKQTTESKGAFDFKTPQVFPLDKDRFTAEAVSTFNKTYPHRPVSSWDAAQDYERSEVLAKMYAAQKGLFLPDGWYTGAYLSGPSPDASFYDRKENLKPVKVMLEIPLAGGGDTFTTKITVEAELPGLPKGIGEFGHLPGVRVRLEGGRVAEWSFFVRGLPGTPSSEPVAGGKAPEGEEGEGE